MKSGGADKPENVVLPQGQTLCTMPSLALAQIGRGANRKAATGSDIGSAFDGKATQAVSLVAQRSVQAGQGFPHLNFGILVQIAA